MRKTIGKIYQGATKLALATGASLALAGQALAQQFDTGNVNPIPMPDVGLYELISKIVNTVLIIVGIVAVLYLVYGGVTYITAGGDAEKATKGRTTITNAIIGIIVIAAALAIYNFVITEAV